MSLVHYRVFVIFTKYMPVRHKIGRGGSILCPTGIKSDFMPFYFRPIIFGSHYEYQEFDFTVGEGKEWLNPSREKS